MGTFLPVTTAQPSDLTTLAYVKEYLPNGMQNTDDDALIQSIISAVGIYWQRRTGINSFTGVASYSEWYDGSGSNRLFLRNVPVVSVEKVTVSGMGIGPSVNHTGAGYVVDQGGRSLVLLSNQVNNLAPVNQQFLILATIWQKGTQNIFVQYTAGYESVPFDIQQASAQQAAAWYMRRKWIDQHSQNVQGIGTTTYQSWAVAPEVEQTIQNYRRSAVIK